MRLLSRRCEICGGRLGPFDRVCPWCNGLNGTTQLSRWRPRAGEIAVRLDVGKPRRALGGGLIVERGQAAVLAMAGSAAVTFQPGPYRFDGDMWKDLVASGVAGRVGLTFVATTDIELRFAFDDLMTKDHLPVSGSGLLEVRVARPALFVANVVRARARFTERDLCQALSRPMADAMADFVGRVSAFDLDSGLETKRTLAAVLEHHLGLTLDGLGLEFVSLRAAQFRQEGVIEERRALGEILLAERELEVMKRRVATREKRSELEAQLAAAETRSRQQVADLRRSLDGRARDQELVRRQMREKMELEHRLELAKLRSQLPPEERAAAPGPPGPPTPPHHRRAAAAYARVGTQPAASAAAADRDTLA